jgi:hypothetical protein
MLKLNASYSKKVPTNEKFSSQSFLASIEVELPHGLTTKELEDKIHDTFDLVTASVTVSETPTFSRANFSAQAAASATPPIQVSAITHSTGLPFGYFREELISLAALSAIFMTCPSSDSRTPP